MIRRLNWLRCAAATVEPARGFTLVELLACTVIVGVLGLIVGSATVAATRMSLRAKRRVELKRDATLVLRLLEKRVRPCAPEDIHIASEGAMLTLGDAPETSPCFRKTGRDLVFSEGETATTLVRGKVEAVAFALEGGHRPREYLLRTTLALADEECRLQIESLTKMRNRRSEP